jgi:hypothetical protein
MSKCCSSVSSKVPVHFVASSIDLVLQNFETFKQQQEESLKLQFRETVKQTLTQARNGIALSWWWNIALLDFSLLKLDRKKFSETEISEKMIDVACDVSKFDVLDFSVEQNRILSYWTRERYHHWLRPVKGQMQYLSVLSRVFGDFEKLTRLKQLCQELPHSSYIELPDTHPFFSLCQKSYEIKEEFNSCQ